MAFDQAGEGGLRRRLRMAVEPPSSVNIVAQALGISAQILDDYLSNPEYVLTSDVYNAIIAGLPSLPINQHLRETSDRWAIIFEEKPYWTQADVNGLSPPEGAENAVLFVYDGDYDDDVASDGPFDLGVFSIQQIIEAATQGDLTLLLTVVWYVPTAEYPYPSG